MRALRSLFVAATMLPLGMAAIPAPRVQAAVFVSVAIAPPAIPVYVQPSIPGPGYVWIPGYWAYGPYGYYWVPGTWVLPPAVGLLWTPGYWDWSGGVYVWRAGYWGPTVGFYGGINYGFGYFGVGYAGGYWTGGHFVYNTAYCNLGGAHITNVYNRTVVNINSTASYHGGRGGTTARSTSQEVVAAREHHIGATSVQNRHANAAAADPEMRASVNHGRPTVAATARPGQFGSAQTHGQAASPGTRRQPTAVNPTQGRSAPAATTGHDTVPQSHGRTLPRGPTPSAPTKGPHGVSTPNASAAQAGTAQPHGRSAPRVGATPKYTAQPHKPAPPHSTSRPATANQRGGMRAPSGGQHPPTSVSQPHGRAAPMSGAPKPNASHGGKAPPAQSNRGNNSNTPGQ